jgi:hypothetical protein
MSGIRSCVGSLAAAALVLAAGLASFASAQDAASLREQEAALRERLSNSPFRRPVVLESTEANGALKGDVYAVLAHPFGIVGQALPAAEGWCVILMLQTNIKDCRLRGTGGASVLSVNVGRTYDQPLGDTYQVDFNYRVAASTPDHLAILLTADSGPVGTRNYRVVFEATPLDAKRTFVHLSYAYRYGAAARLAMKGYLATTGRDKVGFSVVDRKPDGAPVYVAGERGMIERNTMRQYLAIEAYLGAHGLPPGTQQEKRLNDWFAAIERYPRQLGEDIGREAYLDMKRRELGRRQTASAAAPA